MRVTSKGQVTIPQSIRDKYGFLPETDVAFVEEGERVYLVKQPATTTPGRGQRLLTQLRGRGTVGMTTEEILALTPAKVADAFRKHVDPKKLVVIRAGDFKK